MKQLDNIISRNKLLLPILNEIQHKNGYISEDIVRDLSRKTKIPMSEIYGVITFYSCLTVKPQGKCVIHLCNNPSCYVNGSMDIIKHLEKKLKIKSGQTTKDRKFTLHIGSCIGCCDKGPAMLINGKVKTNLTVKKIDEILKKCKSSKKQT